MRKIDELDVIHIRRLADTYIKVNTEIRYGQAIFNAAFKLFPRAVRNLTGNEYDCYYDSNKIDVFLKKLREFDAE